MTTNEGNYNYAILKEMLIRRGAEFPFLAENGFVGQIENQEKRLFDKTGKSEKVYTKAI